MSSSVRVRLASEAELKKMVEVGEAAFEGSPIDLALFPERLRTSPGNEDAKEYRLGRWHAMFPKPEQHFIVVVEDSPDGGEEIIGAARWASPPVKEPTEEEKAAKKKEMQDSLPPCMDKEILDSLLKDEEQWVKEMMGEDGNKNYWVLGVLAVLPNHQRKGAGRLLVQWGIDQAAKDNRDTWLIATPTGRKLYTAMGFEILGERNQCGQINTCMWKKRPENRA